ncbi:MAG: protein phosphatase 2C domain-containing protein [Planctomycetia bacterium]|nr:protein phosphatase 2C domain-containing protein [Planctomycetia bacterium]
MAVATPHTPSLFLDCNMESGELCALWEGSAAVFSRRSPDKQTANEDAAALIPFDGQSGILVVADGLGGSRAGEQASSLALSSLQDAMAEAAANGADLRSAILNGIETANRKIVELGIGAGTTLALVEIQGRTARPYHVGDSMILVVGQRGRIKWQTVSHSPVGYAVESGFLDAAEAMHHDERHIVSNMLGMADMRIEIGSTIELADRDTLLLSSDGLFDNLHVDEIVERVRKGPLDHVARDLATTCRERMQTPRDGQPSKPDDLTFIAYRLGGAGRS